ncbi:MAG: hypothetical protein AAGB19_08015 [Cyanobacteria bacterium P01_F01_bin.3]
MEISEEQLYERLGISAEELQEFCVRSHIIKFALKKNILELLEHMEPLSQK